MPSPPPGHVRLATRLKQIRHERGLTQERLAVEASSLDPETTVSVDTVRLLESTTRARRLPRRRPPRTKFAVELVMLALNVEIEEILADCFSTDELRDSCFSWVIERQAEKRSRLTPVLDSESLADFVQALPTDARHLLDLPGIVGLRNGRAFAFIFALERALSGLEMALLNEPPVMFLDDAEIAKWALGMKLSPDDYVTFLDLVGSYKEHFRSKALSGRKHYRIVLLKQTFYQFLTSKAPSIAAGVIDDILYMLNNSSTFDLVLLELPAPVDEFEVLSAYREVPSSFELTVSLVIRQTSMSAQQVDIRLHHCHPHFPVCNMTSPLLNTTGRLRSTNTDPPTMLAAHGSRPRRSP